MKSNALLHRVAFAALAMGPFLSSSARAQDLTAPSLTETIALSPHYKTDHMLELPVVCFGELHNDPPQGAMTMGELECRAVKQLADEGYGTLLLEVYPCLTPEMERFLQSGTVGDAEKFCERFFRLQTELFKDPDNVLLDQQLQALSPAKREAAYAQAGKYEFKYGDLRHTLELAMVAKTFGMKVHLIDCNPETFRTYEEETNGGGADIRNRVMAERIAFYARSSSKGVVWVGGVGHEMKHDDYLSTIPQKLKELGIRNIVTITPSSCLEYGQIAAAAEVFDAVVDVPEQVVETVKKKEIMQMLSDSVARTDALQELQDGSTEIDLHFVRRPAPYVPRERASIAQK